MFPPDKLIKQSNSLIELLTAQCADLEQLLALSRLETLAAQEGNFDGILKVVSQRAKLGEKLETFQRQIAELRERLSGDSQPVWEGNVAARMSEIVRQIMSHDAQTRFLMATARQKSIEQLNNLDFSQRGSNAYLREKKKGLAYDQSF